MDGVKVFFLEIVAGFGGDKHFSGESDGRGRVLRCDWLFGSKSFIDAHYEFGNVMKPGELRVVDDEPEELAAVNGTMLALVVAALHIEKGLVELEERQAESDEFLACGRVVVSGG